MLDSAQTSVVVVRLTGNIPTKSNICLSVSLYHQPTPTTACNISGILVSLVSFTQIFDI